MCKIKEMSLAKRLFLGVIALALVATGAIRMPIMSNASEGTITKENGVIYKPCDIGTYWTTEEKTVPIEKDYVFGGWFTTTDNGETFTALKEAQITTNEQGVATNENTYAKFVPAYVLSIKMQIEADAVDGDTTSTCLRILSAVDSTDYQSVGFDIWLGSRTNAEETPVISKVYSQLKLSASDSDENAKKPETEFGAAADYFSVLRISDIVSKSYQSIVYARPYWMTMDGTKVEGLGKYVRVEDAFDTNKYMSVPVNLLSGEDVAAGMVTVNYDPAEVQVVDVQTGRLLKDMEYHVDKDAGTVKFVGNATTVGQEVAADGLYANIRFQDINATDTFGDLSFTVNKFCNWKEKIVDTVKVWAANY